MQETFKSNYIIPRILLFLTFPKNILIKFSREFIKFHEPNFRAVFSPTKLWSEKDQKTTQYYSQGSAFIFTSPHSLSINVVCGNKTI